MIRYQYSNDSVKYDDIRQSEIANKEHQLAKDFVANLGSPKTETEPEGEYLFSRCGYKYFLDKQTWDVKMHPMPSPKDMEDYNTNSELARYRASEDFQSHASEARKSLWQDLVEWAEGRVFRHLGSQKYSVADFGSRYQGWVRTLQESKICDQLQLVSPLPPFNTDQTGALTESSTDIVTAFDTIQRNANPTDLLLEIYKGLKPGGIALISARSGSGFDILALGEDNTSVFPFEHLYLPSPWSLSNLSKNVGFEVLEISTPGLLDAETVKRATQNSEFKGHPFIKILSEKTSIDDLQSFLQRNHLSSHLKMVLKKPNQGN